MTPSRLYRRSETQCGERLENTLETLLKQNTVGNMTKTSQLHVVLGATGGVGQALVQELAAQGAQVRAVNRTGHALAPAGVEVMAADLSNRESTRTACQGATVVSHCAGLPYHQWATYMPVWLDNVIATVSATGATLVYIDNPYMAQYKHW
jgi:NAD(P)-dependent dehydrogenase (short-subunit alcohol dehydrogenase family)